jgi:hypothetical protein
MPLSGGMEVAMIWNGFPVAVLLLAPLGAVSAPTPVDVTMLHSTNDQAAVAQFTDAVNRYMNLRWTVEAPLGPEGLCSDPEETRRGLERLAQAIRTERIEAQVGDVFTPAVASFFRQHIAAARYELGYEFATYLEDTDIQTLVQLPRLEVNGSLRWNTGDPVWPFLLRRLPRLPAGLEYRFVGRDLVLVDADIDVVIDILENGEDGS